MKAEFKKFKEQFQIFKEGNTNDGPVWIITIPNQIFDQKKKIQFYQNLGYTVTNIQPT